jgi:hypothetical protein
MIHKDYSNHKYWKVYSSHDKGKRLAEHCTILSRGNPFSLSYDAKYGWYIYFIISGRSALPNKLKVAKFYIDKKFIGEKTGSVSSKTRGVFIPLGLDTTILNPIFKGNVLNIVVGKIRIAVGLAGIKRAYHKALGCWRERMDSVPYVANKIKKKNEELEAYKKNKKIIADNLQSLDLTKKSFLIAMGLNQNLDGLNFYLKPSKLTESIKGLKRSEIYLEKAIGDKDIAVGNVTIFEHKQERLSLGSINKHLNDLIANEMSSCKKTGIENNKPYFIGQTVEVHSRVMLCSNEEGSSVEGRYWLLQSDTYVLRANFILPSEKTEQIEDKVFEKVIESIATGLTE